jgi:integrase/recombinase XerD
MNSLRQKMIEDMQLRGLSEKTQDAYVRVVRQLAEHCDKSPDLVSEEEPRLFFLYLKNGKQVSSSTLTVALCGLKFFYEHMLRREWVTLDLVHPARKKRLPVVLSIAQVRGILGHIRHPRYRVCLSSIYACGLRLGEGVHLQVRNIDSDRMVVHVQQVAGAHPLAPFALWHAYSLTHSLNHASGVGRAGDR